jgi:hypothetical protein
VTATLLVLALAQILGPGGEVWVAAEGLAPSPGVNPRACAAPAFAVALRAQRPGVVVHEWQPESAAPGPPEGAVRARLVQRDGVVTLEVRGAGISLARTLPATDPCVRNVATSALILDGALDVLRAPTKAPTVDSLAPPVPFAKQLHVSAVVGAGTEQGMFGFVPAFALGGAARYRYVELTLDAGVGLTSQTTFTIQPPEATRSGTFAVIEGSAELGVDLTPRLGPGRLAAGVGAGVSFIHASASSTGIFQQEPETATQPFAALRLGYALDLPRGLFLAVRAEERARPPATFAVDGAAFAPPLGQDTVTTPVWTFLALALLGYHFS